MSNTATKKVVSLDIHDYNSTYRKSGNCHYRIGESLRRENLCWVLDPQNILEKILRANYSPKQTIEEMLREAVLDTIEEGLCLAYEGEQCEDVSVNGSWGEELLEQKKNLPNKTIKVQKITSPKTGKKGWKIEMI